MKLLILSCLFITISCSSTSKSILPQKKQTILKKSREEKFKGKVITRKTTGGRHPFYGTGREGRTPLHKASFYGDLDLVKYLVSKGAKVNAKDKNAQTPLLFAVFGNYFSIMKHLIKNGAKVNIKDKNGHTPLHLAARKGYYKPVRIKHKVSGMRHTLYTRSKTDSIKTVKILIKSGAKVNIKNKNGITPLHVAILGHHVNIVKYLVENGADIYIEIRSGKYEGKNAIDLAEYFQNDDEIAIYLEDISKKREKE